MPRPSLAAASTAAALLAAALLAGCPLLAVGDKTEEAPVVAPAAAPPAPPPPPPLQRFSVELRQKVNTCGPLDPQVAFDTFAVLRQGEGAVVFAGTDRVFPVAAEEKDGAWKLSGRIVEPDPTKASGRTVVCKKNTLVDLELKGEALTGSYTRENAQDCIAKGCAVTFSVEGKEL